MKIRKVRSGDHKENPLNKEWMNQLVWAANAFLNLKLRFNDREYVPIYSENGTVISLNGSGSLSNATTGSVSYISSSIHCLSRWT